MRIALLTDFGTRDPYVAAMKGVIAARTSVVTHDLSHELPPFDVFAGAWFLSRAVPYWPAGTIFVCIVDPGVGSARRILAVESGRKLFLAPDNGVLTFVARDAARIVDVTEERFFLPNGSNTFHGRDRFAPVAAALAEGLPLETLGRTVTDAVLLDYEPPQYSSDRVVGRIVSIDHYGNAITDIDAALIPFSRFDGLLGTITICHTVRTYAEADAEPFFIVGSSGCIEISIANGSAADCLQLSRFATVELWPKP